MPADNMYPSNNISAMMREPSNQAKEREQRIHDTLMAIPLLSETVARLDEKIAFYTSVDAIDDALLTNPDAFMHAVAANKITVSNLMTERDYIMSRIEEAAARKDTI